MRMSSPSLSERERAIRQRLRDDFAHYARKCLRIRTKAGKVEPLELNSAQQFIHGKLQSQIERTGKVRAIICKGRQQGCSTYVEGRYYWRVTHRRGVQAFILTHEQEATNNLFAMVQRYHDNCPALVRPETGAANAKELSFARLDSGYKVGTAGTKGVGRSQTIQYFHGSEVAFWPFAETHAAGVLQAVPDQPGTEVILESTGNGLGNYFYDQWQKAIRGEGEFEPIFVPWFWQPEYARDDPEFEMRPDEREMAQTYNLSAAQMAWRRFKVVELGSDALFRQEYPMTPEEAFQADTSETLIPVETVRQAVGRDVKPMSGRIIWGVDVARFGDDLSTLAKRRANWLLEPVKSWKGKDGVQLAGLLYEEFRATPIAERPETIAVDVIGVGAGVVDNLRHMGLPVHAVNVAEQPSSRDEFMRLRDELWWKAREWFAARDSRIPDDGALIAELTTVRYDFTTGGKRKVESKDEMKKRGLKSPDHADAFINTFAVSDMPASRAKSYEPPVFHDGV